MKKEKLSLKVKIRRAWKSYKSEAEWYGYIRPILKDILPFGLYHRIGHMYWAVRHRTIDVYHKVDTKLPPGYYDIDTLMIHSCFSLLVRFIEEEYHGVTSIMEHVTELYKSSKEEAEQFPDSKKDVLDMYDRQITSLIQAVDLYKWWKEIYPKYEDSDPWMRADREDTIGKSASIEDRFVPCAFDEDGDPTLYEMRDDRTPDETKKMRKLLDESHAYQERINKEIEDNFVKLVKLRTHLWT
jgi:hypothetical protein